MTNETKNVKIPKNSRSYEQKRLYFVAL